MLAETKLGVEKKDDKSVYELIVSDCFYIFSTSFGI